MWVKKWVSSVSEDTLILIWNCFIQKFSDQYFFNAKVRKWYGSNDIWCCIKPNIIINEYIRIFLDSCWDRIRERGHVFVYFVFVGHKIIRLFLRVLSQKQADIVLGYINSKLFPIRLWTEDLLLSFHAKSRFE